MEKKNIEDGIVALIKKAETELPSDVINALKRAYEIEDGIFRNFPSV